MLPQRSNKIIENNKTSNIQRRSSNITVEIKASEYINQQTKIDKKGLSNYA